MLCKDYERKSQDQLQDCCNDLGERSGRFGQIFSLWTVLKVTLKGLVCGMSVRLENKFEGEYRLLSLWCVMGTFTKVKRKRTFGQQNREGRRPRLRSSTVNLSSWRCFLIIQEKTSSG